MLVQKIDDHDEDLNKSIEIEKQDLKQNIDFDEDKEFEIKSSTESQKEIVEQ